MNFVFECLLFYSVQPATPMPHYEAPASPAPWPGVMDDDPQEGSSRRNILKWETDEALGVNATISPVLYVNMNYPDLKLQFPGKLNFLTLILQNI